MRKEEEGVVIEVSGSMAKIKASRHGDCKNCGACPGDKAMVLEAQNPIDAKVGQRVAFEIKETNMLKAAFVVYILPIILIFMGCMIGTWTGNKLNQPVKIHQIGGGAVFFILSIIYVKFFDKSANNNSKMKPVITKIMS